MKPRVLLSWADYRIGIANGCTFVERSDGRDNLGVKRWRELTHDECAREASSLLRSLSRALLRRQRMAKARRDAGRVR